MLAVLVQIVGYDPVAGVAVTLCAASHDDSRLCHLNGQMWWPTIAKLPTLRYDFFDGAFGGQITAPSSSLTLMVEPWPLFGRYQLADAAIRIWTGELGAAWDGFTLRFDGRVSAQPALADIRADIDFAADDRWLDTALLSTYAGTTGVEGPATLKGQPKPLALGAPRYVAGTLIDTVNSVFQVSGYGRVNGLEAALEKLARYGAPIGDAASFAALVAADVPAGRWATCNAQGLARLGAPPTGQISFLVQGDAAGPDGWARKPGQLIRRIAQIAGGAGKLDDASLNALDAATPFTLSVYLDQQTTGRELIQKIAASVNAVALVSWTGKLFVLPIGLHGGGVTLAADGSNLPPVSSVKQVDIDAPYQKLAIGAERAWTVHALGDIAFEAPLIDRGRYDPNETYREGNIVDLADGSRWLDVATAPVKGITPGAVGDTTWFNMNPATKAGDITYENGDTLEEMKPAEPGATKGAPAGTMVGDKDVFELLKDMQDNITSVSTLLKKNSDLTRLINEVGFVKGQSAATYTEHLETNFNDGISVINGFLDLFVSKSADGTAAILNSDVTFSGPDGTGAQSLQELSAKSSKANLDVQFLRDTIIGPDGTGEARALLQVKDGDTIAGINLTAGGAVGALKFLASIVQIIDDNGGNPIIPFNYINGILYLGNVVAQHLTVEGVANTFDLTVTADGFSITIPGGLIFKGGKIRGSIGQEAQFNIVFPEPFPTACVFGLPLAWISTANNLRDLYMQALGDPTPQGFGAYAQASTGNAQSLDGINWFAIGF